MANDVYLRLREQLDQYSMGFPATESGVELRLLKKLFTEEEAETFLVMSLNAEEPEAIAGRMKRGVEEVASRLEKMADKGVAFRLRKGAVVKYSAVPFVAGVYEFQVGNMDRELAELFEQYCEEGFHEATAEGAGFMRPIPVDRSVDTTARIGTYDDAREMVKGQKLMAVLDCICRLQQGLIDKGCGKPLDVCLVFGSWAEYCIERKMGRQVSVEEVLKILDRAEEAGLVTQPANSMNPIAICNCCGDCCAVLRALNRHPRPVDLVASNYYAVVDADLCTACEICLERCQMGAVTMNEDDIAQINLARCIGCGLCVTTCPGEALRLEPKPEDQRRVPPAKGNETLMEFARKRGKSLTPLAWSR